MFSSKFKKIVLFLILLVVFLPFSNLKAGEVSLGKSTLLVNKYEAYADNQDYIYVIVKAFDLDNQVLINNPVELFWSFLDGDVYGNSAVSFTDSTGQAVFKLKSIEETSFLLEVKINDQQIYDRKVVEFVEKPFDYTQVNRLVKIEHSTAVYFLDENNIRHAYPTSDVYYSYFGQNFDQVEVISKIEMGAYPLGDNVPFKEGTLMKVPSIPKVYQVQENAEIRWLKSEEVAKSLYGVGWASFVYDLPESFFMNYVEGEPIE